MVALKTRFNRKIPSAHKMGIRTEKVRELMLQEFRLLFDHFMDT